MMLDDVYGSDVDEALQMQEAAWRERVLPELEWDEAEDLLAVEQLLGGLQMRSHDYA
jgi:hypothetical protein